MPLTPRSVRRARAAAVSALAALAGGLLVPLSVGAAHALPFPAQFAVRRQSPNPTPWNIEGGVAGSPGAVAGQVQSGSPGAVAGRAQSGSNGAQTGSNGAPAGSNGAPAGSNGAPAGTGSTTPGPAHRAAAFRASPLSTSTAGPAAYWLAGADGGVFSFGGVPFLGSAGATALSQPIVAMAALPSGRGYWLLARDGGVFAYGAAPFAGSPAALPAASRPTSRAVAMAATHDGLGYWVVTANGSVYTFGDAPFFGSLGGLTLSSPVVGMASTPDGRGYWMASADGSVFSFGDAGFAGSAYPLHPNLPIVGIAAGPAGAGYWLVASDGGIFTFGSATFHGSTGALTLNEPVVGMAATPDGGGYWLVASDGGIFTFGDAAYRGSTGGRTLNQSIVAIAVGHTLDPYPPGATGYDISFPQCGGTLPPAGPGFGVVGVNGGQAFTDNPCLASEAPWAGSELSVYMNLNAPPTGSTQGLTGPAGHCVGNDTGCIAYNYGFAAALNSFNYASAEGVSSVVWWLDIETANTWDTSLYNNQRTIQGAIDALTSEGVVVGVYSTGYQWGLITGGFTPNIPAWLATGSGYAAAVAGCQGGTGFTGGAVWVAQFQTSGVAFDQDYACPVV